MRSADLEQLREHYLSIADRPDLFPLSDFILLHRSRFYFRPSIHPCVVAIDWGAAWRLMEDEYRPAPRVIGRPAAAAGMGGSGLVLAVRREDVLERIWRWAREWNPVLLDGKRLAAISGEKRRGERERGERERGMRARNRD